MFGFFEKAPPFDPSKNVFLDIKDNLESNIPGLYIVGDLTGFPLIKTAINQGTELIDRLEKDVRRTSAPEGVYDLIIVGAGCAGLSAALRAQEKGLSYLVLEQGKIANTIANFPSMKKIFDEPKQVASIGKLYVAETTKEDLLANWYRQVEEARLNIHTMEPVKDVRREKDDRFVVETAQGTYVGKRVLLAIGKRGNPRKLGVPGEDQGKVANELHNPQRYEGSDILVVGGGDAGAETALALCEKNRVTFAVASESLSRPKKQNRERVLAQVAAGRIDLKLNATVKSIGTDDATLQVGSETVTIPNDFVFTMIGSDPPLPFLSKIGVRVKGAWTNQRVGLFALSTLFFTLLYLYKLYGAHLPLIGGLYQYFPKNVFGANWYGLLYTITVLTFGLHALLKPRPRHVRFHKYIRLRYASTIVFQVGVYFLIPAFLLHQDFRIVGLFHLWPLSIGNLMPATYNASPAYFWASFCLSFLALPVFVYFFGKRYCSFICGCGALAETMGDSTRDLSPKGFLNRKKEIIVYGVLAWAFLHTLFQWIREPLFGKNVPPMLNILFGTAYGIMIDWLWAGVIGVGAYFFFGSRIWCRYGCPLAILMNLYGKIGLKSRFEIVSNDKCIDCGQCNRYCQMGIDVKKFAIEQKPLTLKDTPCIGCGECIAVCPMEVLSFGPKKMTPNNGLIRELQIIEHKMPETEPTKEKEVAGYLG
jgi:thioredoxin reductase/ferredoxin